MKFYIYLLAFLLLHSACSNPQKLIEKNRFDKALLVSNKRLKKGKIKTDHVAAFEIAFRECNYQDLQKINIWRNSGQPSLWPKIFNQALLIQDRQNHVLPVMNRLTRAGIRPEIDLFPIKALLDEARHNSALFYYAHAQEHIPAARNGNRNAARAAFYALQKSLEYVAEFKDASRLREDMKNLGTTHILISPLTEIHQGERADWIYHHFFKKYQFPIQSEWQVLHLDPIAGQNMHYDLLMVIENIYVSSDQESSSDCTNTKEIETGQIVEKEWSEKDSSYIDVIIPIIEEVSVTVTEYEQSKNANINMSLELIDKENHQVIKQKNLNGRAYWSNTYSTSYGDSRAEDICCYSSGGSWCSYPTKEHLLLQSIKQSRRGFNKLIKAFHAAGY